MAEKEKDIAAVKNLVVEKEKDLEKLKEKIKKVNCIYELSQ